MKEWLPHLVWMKADQERLGRRLPKFGLIYRCHGKGARIGFAATTAFGGVQAQSSFPVGDRLGVARFRTQTAQLESLAGNPIPQGRNRCFLG